jgi:hypothetical protein
MSGEAFMTEHQVGKVTHYFDHIQVAVLALAEVLRVGDTIHFHGHSTDFTQKVESMQLEHKGVDEGKPGQDVALKTAQKVHEHDAVFKVTE